MGSAVLSVSRFVFLYVVVVCDYVRFFLFPRIACFLFFVVGDAGGVNRWCWLVPSEFDLLSCVVGS